MEFEYIVAGFLVVFGLVAFISVKLDKGEPVASDNEIDDWDYLYEIHHQPLCHFNDDNDYLQVNPATGLPMVGGIGGVDVHGNVYGDSDD